MGDQTAPAEAKAEPKAKLVKIRLLRECSINGQICPVGSEHMVNEEVAKEFCDRKFKGYIPAYGYLPEIGPLMTDEFEQPLQASQNPLNRKEIVRAMRLNKTA